ncbi:MAG: putative bifunctional diguanylate cyclase/phosphodiesterase [Hyphomicrobiales bacterium]
MLRHLQNLANICTRSDPTTADVLAACQVIRGALGASDAYVIRAGDPHFIRVGSDCPPDQYEIKQKGYWLVWRQLVTQGDAATGVFDVHDRLVSGGRPLTAGARATHAAALLQGDESKSEMLILSGPWDCGMSDEQVQFIGATMPSLASLVRNVVDTDRRARQRQQLESLANVADVFTRARSSEDVLASLATTLAKASGIDWVNFAIYNSTASEIIDRATNITRHWKSSQAAEFQGRPRGAAAYDTRLGVELTKTDGCILIRDTQAERLENDPAMGPMAETLPWLQRFWQRAHISSVALFPIAFQGHALGQVAFSSIGPRNWDADVDFLKALVSQTATVIKALQLFGELEASREELRRREERFRSLVQNASDLITVVGPDGRVTYQSPSIAQVLGFSPSDVEGRLLTDFVHEDDVERAITALNAWEPGGNRTAATEITVRHRDGSWREIEFIGTDQRDNPAIGGIVLNMRDVSERKRLEQRLLDQALRDPLSGLVNRRGFGERLDERLHDAEAGSPVAVLFLDLDNFKEVNDTLGHANGDRLLAEVGRRIRACVRPGDTVARLGGDEFAILVSELVSPEAASAMAGRILNSVQRPLLLGDSQVTVRASVGIAIGDGAARDCDVLLRQADLAMYRAKAEGKGCFRVFEPEMLSSTMDRHELLNDLRAGIDREEFVLHYQPMVTLGDGQPAGVEALVRWQHPRRGLLGPGEFVPLAEETGTIVPLGRWVLREACRQAAEWIRSFPICENWTMSVNVSVKQLQQPEFIDEVRDALNRSGLLPPRLVLEMTESVMVRDPELMRERLEALKALGVRLAVDDFATGYSSLTYLREFPVDLLKIDRSFVGDIGVVAPEQELARVIIELGKTLGISVVAEGIERPDQFGRLRELQCELGQGFYFAKPLGAAEAEAMLREWPAARRAA